MSDRSIESQKADRLRVEQIRNGGPGAEQTARQLFFELFDFIERSIQSRLCDRGLAYDATSEHFNDVFDYVLERIFTPQSMAAALERYAAEKGALATWIQNRVVYVIRDWLKSRHRSHIQPQVKELAEDVAAGAQNIVMSDADSVVERALESMTGAQRASMALLLLRVRSLRDDDIAAVAEVSGCSREQIVKEVNDLASTQHVEALGQREKKLHAELQLRHVQRIGLVRRKMALRQRLMRFHLDEANLLQIETDAENATLQEIHEKYSREIAASGKKSTQMAIQRQFELCCHDAALTARRLNKLQKEESSRTIAPLLSYAEVAEVLRCSIARVNGYLHRARVCLESQMKSRNPRDDFAL